MTKEEEAGSYSMSDDTNQNKDDYICSDDYNIGGEDDNKNTNLKHKSQAWGTWEELLLACAVKRHGFGDWDSVATEVRSRSSISAVFVSPNNCRQKYRDLKRRFHESAAGDGDAATATTTEEGGNNIPWLEQLRSLRVAELRREVQQYDVSILSLQLKVKKLEEERDGDEKLDLEDERKGERSENDGGFESERREKAVSTAEESDRDNRSMNESNSTGSGEKTVGEDERVGGDEPSQTRDHSGGNNPDPDPVNTAEEGSEASHSGELGESGTSERKWKRKRRKHSADSKNNHDGGDGEVRSAASKSQPLIRLLDLIRSHPRGSLFERRLRSQETEDYKSLVKQHLDIETIQRKLKQGSYDDSSSLTFYRDLQLLFTNAIIFFPSSSSESMAAHELRTIVFEEMRKETQRSGPRLIKQEASAARTSIKADAETSESSLERKNKSSAPLVVCKRRRFVSAKGSPSSSSFSQKEETKEETLSEEKEINATGGRSPRRSNKVVAAAAGTKTGKGKNKQQKETESKTNSSNDNTNNSSKQERGKTEKKVVSSDKKKSVADFLKRLNKNSPQKEGKDQNKSGGNGKKESKAKPRELRSNNVGKKKKAEVENTPVKRAPGRPQKKTAEAAATATASASGKRARESGSTGKDKKQPKKRSRR